MHRRRYRLTIVQMARDDHAEETDEQLLRGRAYSFESPTAINEPDVVMGCWQKYGLHACSCFQDADAAWLAGTPGACASLWSAQQ